MKPETLLLRRSLGCASCRPTMVTGVLWEVQVLVWQVRLNGAISRALSVRVRACGRVRSRPKPRQPAVRLWNTVSRRIRV